MLCPQCLLTIQDNAWPPTGQSMTCPRCGSDLSRSQSPAATERFDPYYTWLGIPPAEQPPNSYRLLGLQLFEANRPVIENAADRQMKHLRSFQIGARAADSQRLLNEVSAARIQLLDATRKASYDEQLRHTFASPTAPFGSPANSPSDGGIAIQRRDVEKKAQVRRSPPGKSVKSVVSMIGIVVGGIFGLAMGVMVIFYLTGQDLLGLSGKMRNPPESPPVVVVPSVVVPKVKLKTPLPQSVLLPSTQPKVQPSVAPGPPPPPPAAPSPLEMVPSAAPAPTPIAPVARAGPVAARLPALLSREPSSLLPLSADPVDPLDIAIYSGAADIPAKSSIIVEKVTSSREWTVSHISQSEPTEKKEPLGMILQGRSELTFAWKAPLVDAPARRQLANCLLEIRHGSEPKIAQLREVAKSEPLVLDFHRANQTVAVDVDDLPAYGKIVLKIRELSNFARGGKLRGDIRTLALGKTAFIEFTDMPGAEIELRFVLAPAGGGLILRSDSVFKEKSRRNFDLTYAALEKEQAEVERQFSTMQSELIALKSSLETAKTNLKNLPPTATRPQIVAAASLVSTLGQQVATIERALPAQKARLDAVPSVKAFMDFLDKRATIQFSVCAIAGDKEVVLAECGR